MQIMLELPEDIAQKLESTWKDMPRAALESLTIPVDGAEVRFTVSVGVATFSTGISITTAMEHADHALYRAKQNGRNRVEVAEPVAEAAQP